LGAYYADLAARRVPLVLTLDALFALAHAALDRALAEAEDRKLMPATEILLRRLDARLAAERPGATLDLVAAYTTARGIVAVGRSLWNPAYVAPPELAEIVAAELARVRAHNGPAESPLLGVVLDYSLFASRGALAGDADPRARAFRTMTWLSQAPLMLATDEEIEGGERNVSRVRTHARAALLLARLVDFDVDAESAHAWEELARLGRFVMGAPDDVSLRELMGLAVRAGLDAGDARAIANVARVDRVRHLARVGRLPRLYDGAGGLRVLSPPGAFSDDPSGGSGVSPDRPRVSGVSPDRPGVSGVSPDRDAGFSGGPWFERAALSVRVLGASAVPDAEVLQRLVFPAVGPAALRAPSDSDAQAPAPARSTEREGRRALPTALDVAAWLGSPEARTILHESGDDAYAGYDTSMTFLEHVRPKEAARHASLHLSALDAIGVALASSAADPINPAALSPLWRRRNVEAALAAWTELRHEDAPFSRQPNVPPVPLALRTDARADDARLAVGFVEPHPEAIAALVALLGQARRGLVALGALGEHSEALAVAIEIEDILGIALRVALREANDEAVLPSEAADLAGVPRRLARLDARLEPSRSAELSVAAGVHTDLEPARVLVEATGGIDDLLLLMREPASPKETKLVLAVGASIPHYELTQPAALRLSDEGWRARLRTSPPPRGAYTSAYVVARDPKAR
jgi:hypothetical protein